MLPRFILSRSLCRHPSTPALKFSYSISNSALVAFCVPAYLSLSFPRPALPALPLQPHLLSPLSSSPNAPDFLPVASLISSPPRLSVRSVSHPALPSDTQDSSASTSTMIPHTSTSYIHILHPILSPQSSIRSTSSPKKKHEPTAPRFRFPEGQIILRA